MNYSTMNNGNYSVQKLMQISMKIEEYINTWQSKLDKQNFKVDLRIRHTMKI